MERTAAKGPGKTVARVLRYGLMVTVATAALYAIAAEGNVLLNGALNAQEVETPFWWRVVGEDTCVFCDRAGGPSGGSSVRFRSDAVSRSFVGLRQESMHLASNGNYRISCMVKARHFEPQTKGAGFFAINRGWTSQSGVTFPSGSYGWKRLDVSVTVPGAKEHIAVVHLPPFRGELSIADLTIEAADAETAARTSLPEVAAADRALRLIPRHPLLHVVPDDDSKVRFELCGQPEGAALTDCEIRLACGGKTTKWPCKKRDFDVALPLAPTGGVFNLTVVDARNGSSLHSRRFSYRTVTVPKATPGKRLNTLVTELVREPLAAGRDWSYSFALDRPGWVFVSADAEAVRIDGKSVIDAVTPNHETFRQLSVGVHSLEVQGGKGGEVILRKVPELFNYCPLQKIARDDLKVGWEFQEKYMLPAVNVLNGGNIPPDRIESVRARGYKWLANLKSTRLKSAEDLLGRIAGHRGMHDASRDGVTCDEQSYYDPKTIAMFADAFWRVGDYPGKSIYTWITGTSTHSGVERDFMSAAANVSESTGKLLTETYCETCASEEEAREYMRQEIVSPVLDMRKYPCLLGNYGVILGDFTLTPHCSLVAHPEVDYRYYLDMQFNLIANDPQFEGMGCTGVWGSNYAPVEFLAWTFGLMRHYFVEGKRSMLSDRYGFKYVSGHLQDGDFREGLKKWSATGSVTCGRQKGLGLCQWRYRRADAGDGYAVFERQGGSVSTLRQTLRDLVPGKEYQLSLMLFDPAFPSCAATKPQRFEINVSFESGAQVCPGTQWEVVDRCDQEKAKRGDVRTKVNYRQLVFKAAATTATLVIDDGPLPVGSRVGINGISVHPYLGFRKKSMPASQDCSVQQRDGVQ